ncbi:Uncharacterised protein [Enterobacter hormaechei]|nr:Uncharacterised protein [Enterobacter hormaechei]
MQRFIGHAQQRAVRDAEAIALRGNGGAFHIDCDRTAEIETQGGGGIAQLPVTIVGGDDRTGTQALLHLFTRHAAHLFGGVVQGALHFRDTRDRNIRRQNRVKDMVVTQISVGEDVIANQLTFTQAAAVADHQPDVRAQYRQMVADGFRIRRANADVNQRNALTVGGDQVPGWHLVLFPRQVGDGLFRCFGFGGDPDPARAGEGDVRAVRIEDLATAPADKFVHIAGVIGKQHERLEMFGWGAGVVAQACQREIDTAGIKVRQR